MMIFFIVMTIAVQNQLLSARLARNGVVVKELANVINNEVVLAQRVSPGYNRTFVLPSQVDGATYALNNSVPEELVIDYRGESYVFFLDGVASITPLAPGINTIYN